MSDTNLDWTFDSIPGDEDAPSSPSAPARPALPAARRPAPRWLVVTLPALVVALAVGASLFGRAGWARLETQVKAEVAYEDERSIAGDVAAVAAVQGGDRAWTVRRSNEARLGLAAPLPAPNLLPIGGAPRVVEFKAIGDDLFEATVQRDYADASGQVYAFELVQRYHNLAPGVWERLPADDSGLANTTVFAGEHLTATFPVADLPWLSQALPQFENILARACIDWQCPPGFKLNVVFAENANSAANVPRVSRPAGAPGQGYPIVFDLPPITASYPDHAYRLPSPHVAGYPSEAQAAAALTRAASVQVLAALASELASQPRRSPDYFLDALVARAEIRLGLTATPDLSFTPHEYMPPTSLWFMDGMGFRPGLSDSLALRRQALGFVNFALAGQPPSVEAGLLRQLRAGSHATQWLGSVLGTAAQEAPARWRAEALAGWPVAPRPGYEGMVVTCGQEALVVGADGLQRVSAHPQGQTMLSAELSADGRRLAALVLGRSNNFKLVLFDLPSGTLQPLPVAQPAMLLGWRPSGELLFLDVHPQNGSSNFRRLLRLRQYDPANGRYTILMQDPVVAPWSERGLWSPDRRTLSLAVFDTRAPDSPLLALVTPGADPYPMLHVRRLDQSGYAPAFSPDGARLAVFSGGNPYPAPSNSPDWRLNLIDWQSNQMTTVLTASEMEGGNISQAGALEWSPDGRWLLFMAAGAGGGPAAFLASAEGGSARLLDGGVGNVGSVPLGFSADSRYVALLDYTGTFATNLVEIIDLAAPPGTRPLRFFAQTAAWAPAGHELLLGGPAGLHAVDAATGEVQWLYDTMCSGEF